MDNRQLQAVFRFLFFCGVVFAHTELGPWPCPVSSEVLSLPKRTPSPVQPIGSSKPMGYQLSVRVRPPFSDVGAAFLRPLAPDMKGPWPWDRQFVEKSYLFWFDSQIVFFSFSCVLVFPWDRSALFWHLKSRSTGCFFQHWNAPTAQSQVQQLGVFALHGK